MSYSSSVLLMSECLAASVHSCFTKQGHNVNFGSTQKKKKSNVCTKEIIVLSFCIFLNCHCALLWVKCLCLNEPTDTKWVNMDRPCLNCVSCQWLESQITLIFFLNVGFKPQVMALSWKMYHICWKYSIKNNIWNIYFADSLRCTSKLAYWEIKYAG